MADLFKGLVEASPAGAMASGVAGAGIPVTFDDYKMLIAK